MNYDGILNFWVEKQPFKVRDVRALKGCFFMPEDG